MKHNYHSTNNQRVLSKLVDREVIANQSYLVTRLMQEHYEEVEIINEYPDNSDEIKELEDLKNKYDCSILAIDDKIDEYSNRLEEAIEKNNSYVQEEYEDKIDILTLGKDKIQERIKTVEEQLSNLEEEQDTPKEPLEFWLVSGWFIDKLKKRGEVIVEIFEEEWWGRTCSGQAILLDYVIGSIGEEMEILEGQENYKYWRD